LRPIKRLLSDRVCHIVPTAKVISDNCVVKKS
jgi:hypothetical protein